MATPVSIPILLKRHLDDLTEERLREFQWYLLQIQVDGSRPIPRSKLENATREETVNILVQVFGEDGAVARTVATLSEMFLNDLASNLQVQAKMDQINQSMEQRVDEPGASSAREEPGASSAIEKPREDDPTVPEELSCSICLCLFIDPVVLQCGHSFCRSCLHQHWEINTRGECPLCRNRSFGGDPPINFILKSLCESYRGGSQGDPSGGHRNNTESFQTQPKNIKEKLEKAKQLCDSSMERIKTQSCNTENKITDDFKMLRALLDEEERTRLDALREEARLKGRMTHLMSDVIENTSSLCDAIEEIGKFGAGERFTGVCMAVMLRMQTDLRSLQTVSQPWINMSEHVENLPLTVLTKMLNDIKQTSVVLDPETASSCLSGSDHLTEVKVNDTRQQCPGNTEYSNCYQEDLQRSPKKMRLEQDYENGKVTFHDPDNKTSILTNEGTFTQKMYPYISPIRVIDEDEVEHNLFIVPIDEDEDEVEQGHAETFREEGAQS